MLKALEIKKELDAKRSALSELEKKDADFETRTSDILSKLETMTAESSKEERDALELDQQNLEAEKVEHDAEKQTVRDAIANLEAELAEEEAKAPTDPTPSELDGAEKRTLGETKKMDVRESKEYINAFARYIKTEKPEECRSLLSTNGTDASASLTGYVPVPVYLEQRIKTAWENSEVMNLVRKTNLKGNVKVGFELSADGAVVHKEGTAAPNEEVVTLGIVTMIPSSIKKWIDRKACQVLAFA